LLFKLDNEAKAKDAVEYEAATATKDTWQPITFNIVPVPAGEFLPAPEPVVPHMRIVASAS
jgi:hypothetical protein